MKQLGFSVLAFAMLVACGDSGNGGSGGNGGSEGGSDNNGGSNDGGSGGGVINNGGGGAVNDGGSGGGTPTCDTSGIQDPACSDCVQANCCAEFGACLDDATCAGCLADNSDPACETNAPLGAIGDCLNAFCTDECLGGPAIEPSCDAPAVAPSAGACFTPAKGGCNPVTNDGCDTAAGEACDFGGDSFQCYPAPNDQALCDECGAAGFCQGTMTCTDANAGQCVRFCCDDGDCGTGVCDTTLTGTTVGLCVAAP
ncbi:MAG: hypothetical protein HOW73_42900 [Polyangiaceae bacterium]|nr:hypothetical protein [Polyangiaceae bacterium]